MARCCLVYVLLTLMHHYVLGKPNTGKTTVLVHEAITAPEPVLFIDPVGTAAHEVLQRIPDALVFDPTDAEYPVSFNFLEARNPAAIRYLLAVLRSVAGYSSLGTPSFDQSILQAAKLVTTTADPTIVAMHHVLTDSIYRKKLIKGQKDIRLVRYWNRYEQLSDRRQEDITASAISQLDLLLADPRMVHVLYGNKSAFAIKDTPFIVARLPVLELGPTAVQTLAMLLIATLFLGKPSPRRVVIDNVDLIAQPLLGQFLSLGSRRGVYFTMAHQYLDQVKPEMQAAFLGYAGRQTFFTLSLGDAERLEKTMEYDNTRPKLHELRPYHARLVDGTVETVLLPPLPPGDVDNVAKLTNLSRQRYAGQRAHVEAKLRAFIGGK